MSGEREGEAGTEEEMDGKIMREGGWGLAGTEADIGREGF